MLWKKWNYLVDDFRVDVGWKMIGLDQSELDFFDNMEVMCLHVFNHCFCFANFLIPHVLFFE